MANLARANSRPATEPCSGDHRCTDKLDDCENKSAEEMNASHVRVAWGHQGAQCGRCGKRSLSRRTTPVMEQLGYSKFHRQTGAKCMNNPKRRGINPSIRIDAKNCEIWRKLQKINLPVCCQASQRLKDLWHKPQYYVVSVRDGSEIKIELQSVSEKPRRGVIQ